jgi:hypothetical protein
MMCFNTSCDSVVVPLNILCLNRTSYFSMIFLLVLAARHFIIMIICSFFLARFAVCLRCKNPVTFVFSFLIWLYLCYRGVNMRVAASLITLLLVSAVVSAKKKKQKKENLFRDEQQILAQRICRATVT